MLHAKKKIPTFLSFTKEQRKGLLSLFVLIVFLQGVYFFMDFNPVKTSSKEELAWVSLQSSLDSMSVKSTTASYKMHPFNPNFISDFKGYKLGMTTVQLDRLFAFRKLGKFANSPEEFQKVTGISDSLLKTMVPYFKFPDWLNKKNTSRWIDYTSSHEVEKKAQKNSFIDINLATKEQLMEVYGIGDAISDRILKQKELFGGFASMEQMDDIWGLSPEVIQKINQSFKVITSPSLKKININSASIKELGQFPYFRYPISKNIVTYRSMNGDVKIEDLIKIKDFPVDKLKIIALYLEF